MPPAALSEPRKKAMAAERKLIQKPWLLEGRHFADLPELARITSPGAFSQISPLCQKARPLPEKSRLVISLKCSPVQHSL